MSVLSERPRAAKRAIAAATALAAVWAIPAANAGTTSAAAGPGEAVTVARAVTASASGAFRGDLRRIPAAKSLLREDLPGPREPQGSPPGLTAVDPAKKAPSPTAATASTATTFDGLNFSQGGCGWPPDTNGDVGATHYVQLVNCAVGIFDKSTGALVANPTLNTFFALGNTATPCDNSNQGDPVVLYDSFGSRWIIANFAWSSTSGPFYECIAVSKTGDPVSGGWNYFALNVGSYLPDYPKLGVWGDGIYLTANMFTYSGSFKYVQTWAINRAKLEATTASFQAFTAKLPSRINGVSVFSLLPSNAKAATGAPPTGRPNFLASIWGTYNIRVWKFQVSSSWTSASVSGPTKTPIATFNVGPSSVPELNGNAIDTLTYRLMMQNQYTNLGGVESLWLTHTVGNGGSPNLAQVRWYQLPVTNNVVASAPAQQATYAPADTKQRFMPSLAVNNTGAMAVGYSVGNGSMFPGIAYAGRCATDPAGTLGNETVMLNGGGAQTYTNRWGDYSAMTLDPDGTTFWYTTEYYATTGSSWSTRIGKFTLNC
jgi:hypothetical protein